MGWAERFRPHLWFKLWHWSLSIGPTMLDYYSEARMHGVAYKVLPTINAASPCTCKQYYPTPPLDGDCVLACRIHHALRFQTKHSIIILFCWSSNGAIRSQTVPMGWTFIWTIDKHEERCLNLKLTTQVHLFLVLTVSPKTGRLPCYEQVRGSFDYQF